MPYIAYREQRFNSKARQTVEQAKVIIEELQEQGYTLTLRQLYYQMVSRNFIPNETAAYKRLGRIICDAREIGEIDWLSIEDRNRGCYLPGHTPTPEDVLEGIEKSLMLNPWLDQDVFLAVGVEKAALEGVIARPAGRWRAPYMSCKGYLSASEAWRTGQRFEAAIAEGKRPVFLHLGDHDPSGLHMTEDNRSRMSLFARCGVFNLKGELLDGGIHVDRLALNRDQVTEHKLPPNPAKEDDTRFKAYAEVYGNESWELDALNPQVIDKLVHEAIQGYVDQKRWEATLELEAERRQGLRLLGMRWPEVLELVQSPELNALERLKALDAVVAEIPVALAMLADRMPKATMEAGKNMQNQALGILAKAKNAKDLKDTVKAVEALQAPSFVLKADQALVKIAERLSADVTEIESAGEFDLPEPLAPSRSPFLNGLEASEDIDYEDDDDLPEGFEED